MRINCFNKKTKRLMILVPFITLISCASESVVDEDMQPKITLAEKTEAIELLEKNCYVCHAPDNSGPRLAPPMFAVKNHYYDEGVTEDEFVESITAYATNPSEENSRMPGAVHKFGVMPQSNFKTEDVRVVAKYLYYGDIKHPSDCEAPEVKEDTTNYLKIGKNAALEVKSVLGKNLFAAIEQQGTSGAIEFCNARAILLTDSVSLAIAKTVRRVTDKPRNLANMVNADESVIMNNMLTSIKQGVEVVPQLIKKDDKTMGYYPIMTNVMCLQCHGKPSEDIDAKTLDKLGYLYPQDKAVGYTENELRGMFVVVMDKN